MWLELHKPPTDEQLNVLNEVIDAWFMVGRVGGYDAMNLQVLCLSVSKVNCLWC
jgi:Protein of unknown function (DUF3531)